MLVLVCDPLLQYHFMPFIWLLRQSQPTIVSKQLTQHDSRSLLALGLISLEVIWLSFFNIIAKRVFHITSFEMSSNAKRSS